MISRYSFPSCITFSALVFTVLNIYWTMHFFYSKQCPNNTIPAKITKIALASNYAKDTPVLDSLIVDLKHSSPMSMVAFDDLNFTLGRWDQQRLYKFYDFALVGDTFAAASECSVVCLATQGSVERLYSIVQAARQWRGPISVAVYVAGKEEFFILQYYVTYLRMCFDFLRSNVTFHVAIPRNRPPEHGRNMLKEFGTRFDCQYPEQMLRRLLHLRTTETMRWRIRNEYPQNHMRNLARKNCQNKYVFLTDIDIIPSDNIVPQLNNFLRSTSCNKRCAYVIPTFEIDVRAKFPDSKMDLLRLFKKNLARPFHEKVFIYNQYATNFSRWLSNLDSETGIHISHTVTNFEFLYEPFYVALDNVPVHDERFLGYGFTRNSQVYEMYIAGYTFYVLSPVFTCHWGLQQKKTRPVWREQQNNINRKRFEIFKSEIFARYKNNP